MSWSVTHYGKADVATDELQKKFAAADNPALGNDEKALKDQACALLFATVRAQGPGSYVSVSAAGHETRKPDGASIQYLNLAISGAFPTPG